MSEHVSILLFAGNESLLRHQFACSGFCQENAKLGYFKSTKPGIEGSGPFPALHTETIDTLNYYSYMFKDNKGSVVLYCSTIQYSTHCTVLWFHIF